MGPVQPAGGFLWYCGTAQCQRGVDFTERAKYPTMLFNALQVECSCSSVVHRKRVYPVKVRHASGHGGSQWGTAVQTDPLCEEHGENGDVYSVVKGEDELEGNHCTAVCTYEDTVAVASGNRVYVSSPTCLGRKLDDRLNSARLGQYMRLALEDEINEHVLPLIEVSAVPKLICSPERVVSVACGTEHVLLCTSVGRVCSMGSNRYGQLGRGTRSSDIMGLGIVHLQDRNSRNGSGDSCIPAAVEVFAGSNFSFAIARNRSTVEELVDCSSSECGGQCAGGTAPGEKLCSSVSSFDATFSSTAQTQKMTILSQPSTTRLARSFPSVPSKALVSHVENNYYGSETCHSLRGGKGEALYSWGCNDYGQLGHGTKESAVRPVQIKRPEGVSSWRSVAAGFAHVVVLTGNDSVYGCGLNLHGQLGLETTREEASLHKIDLPEPVQQVSCGTWHTLFLTSTGHLLTAGRPPEFPYTGWLQSGASSAELYHMNPIHAGTILKCSSDAEALPPAASPGRSSTAVRTNSSYQGPALNIPADRIQAPAPTWHLNVKAEPCKPGTAVLSCHPVLLSTTRQLCRSRVDMNVLAQPRSSTSSDLNESQSCETIPFAHAPGILRVEGFLDELKCISAGQTTSAAIGFDEHRKRYRMYVWRAAEPRERPENWLFMSEVYDSSPLLRTADETKRTTLACSCAASGIYLWTQTSETPFSNPKP